VLYMTESANADVGTMHTRLTFILYSKFHTVMIFLILLKSKIT